ncbi:MAG: RNA polymerase sigma factor [Chloroflexota bacterium]
MKQFNTTALIQCLQAGDLDALGQLYDCYSQMVYRAALGITGDPESASDLLQEVFLRLYRYARGVDPRRPLEPWLYRVATNLAYTWVKREKRWFRPLEEIAEWFVGEQSSRPVQVIENNEERRRVQRAITGLPISQRVVVVLYYINDLSIQETAEVLQVPVGTVKSRLHYGRKALKKTLGLLGESMGEVQYEFT